ncbi:MAG: hypothetical protein MRERC_2c147 [Mycoplasmataceae bacterium RC_NB112A]|nr:MAG: hypothetical protein MRERC_2c147 [Mycoplasmataceae bacterium RC_NB112A]
MKKNRKELEKEKSVKLWKEDLLLETTRLEIFIPSDFFFQLTEKTKIGKLMN